MPLRVGAFVEGIAGGEDRLGVGIDKIHVAPVPAGVANAELREMAVAAGDLEAPAPERQRAIAAPLGARDLGPKGAAEVVTAGAGPADVGAGQVALERRGVELGVVRD